MSLLSRKQLLDIIANYEQMALCTPNERLFLDEVREKGHWNDYGQIYINNKSFTGIFQDDFTANLKELAEIEETT